MRTVLHILTRSPDPLADDIILAQRELGELRVQIVDLTKGDPDYDELLDGIFSADSVEVW
jgi:hypothetical protein